MKLVLLMSLVSISLFARLEWPGHTPEGGFCDPDYIPGFQCLEGLICDSQGFCRKPCADDSDCKENQHCDKDDSGGFCL